MRWLRSFSNTTEASRLHCLLVCSAVVAVFLAFNSSARLEKASSGISWYITRSLQGDTDVLWPGQLSAKPVAQWGCAEVRVWLLSQDWQWRELDSYAQRLCELGVTGGTLHLVDATVLSRDVGVQYAFHQHLLLDKLRALAAAAAAGVGAGAAGAGGGNLLAGSAARGAPWQQGGVGRNALARSSEGNGPSPAALYFTGLLCCPRLTMVWLRLRTNAGASSPRSGHRPFQQQEQQQPAAPSAAMPVVDSHPSGPTSLPPMASAAAAPHLQAHGELRGCAGGGAALPGTDASSPPPALDTWPLWLAAPGLCTALAAVQQLVVSAQGSAAAGSCERLFSVYVAAIGLLRTLAEVQMLHCLLTGRCPGAAGGGAGRTGAGARGSEQQQRRMPARERLVRSLFSHVLTPAVCCLWGVLLKVVVARVLPPWAGVMACWACCLLLPPWSVWWCLEVWSPQPPRHHHQRHHYDDDRVLVRRSPSRYPSRRHSHSGHGSRQPYAPQDNLHHQHDHHQQQQRQHLLLRQGGGPGLPRNGTAALTTRWGSGTSRGGSPQQGSGLQEGGSHHDVGRQADAHGRGRVPTDGGGSGGRASKHWPAPLRIPERLRDHPTAPSFIRCPITLSVMSSPAQTPAGITYEHSALMQWLDRQRCDPVTRAPLKRRHVTPNLALRGVIEQWLEDSKRGGAPAR